ncbi:caffeic acid 3-O-methyltransferase-like [Melia azedarach]|uniref:Caffeic acid 3-O-methyltransferase-like n=1 Tax=Melia azedarach TaxID=155640 RepID=A0ACC1X7R1_MELAZ|nr:caffeic acid 3-O-methyltransferase-like [Melia azedarach]
MENKDIERSKSARLAILELANMISVPMSLMAVLRLNIPDIIWQDGANIPLSAIQILEHIIPSGGGDAENLQRILRLLTSHGIFEEQIGTDGSPRKYSLTEVGKTLATDSEGLSHAAYILQHHQEELLRTWPLLHEVVLDPTKEPFVIVNGEPGYSYYGKKPGMRQLMQKAMSGLSVPFMKVILDNYDGFKGVERLVDVGGCGGDCLKMILQKHHHIRQGINFDLPEFVANAPDIPGVTHIGGDMYKSVPAGDAIFMKWILTWSDNECKLILENCYKALPAGGKLIACEPLLPEESDDSCRTHTLLGADIFLMTMYKGKQRTEEEFNQLGLSAGFSSLRAFYFDYYFTILEFQK